MRYLLPFLLFPFVSPLHAQGEAFRDASREAGIQVTGRARGVSVCDYNDDGHPDLFLSLLDGPNRLYRNDGTGRFTEVGEGTPLAASGAAMATLWGDYDNDGDQDVLVGNKNETSRLYRNDGGTFTDVTRSSGIDLNTQVQAGSLLDYDDDGLTDIYLSCLNAPNRLYRNLGDLQFEERGADAGAVQSGLGMGTLAFDYDADGDPDLYLVHDGNQPNVLLRNDGGFFTDVSVASGTDVVGDGMGVDAADYDGDGDFDLYVTNLYENFLLRNEGDGTFREIAFDAGVNDLGMGWGTAWLDYDNDGRPDLYVANETGFAIGGQRYNNLLYHNEGTFTTPYPPQAAINSNSSSYGTATADFNGDGRPDLFVTNSGQPSQLFLNTTENDHAWIALTLRPASGNRDGLGARVALHQGGRTQVAEVRAGGSFASQHDRTLHFGLGRTPVIDSVSVYWPDGDTTRYYDLSPNQRYTLTGAAAVMTTSVSAPAIQTLGVYPNPSSGEVYLRTPLRQVRVFDGLGRCVLSLPGPTEHVVLPNGLPSGLYRIVGQGREAVYSGTIQHHTY